MAAVLITGSSRGLGRSLALAFAFDGHNVILHGRDIIRLESVEKDVVRYGSTCQVVVGDLTEDKIIDELVTCAKAFDIGILINNAGVYLQKPVEETSFDEIKYLTEINLFAPIKLTKRIFENHFKKQNYGLIINVNSIAGKNAGTYESIYSATKHALRGFMNSFQYETIKYHVSILNVYLGAMATDMTSGRRDSEKFIKPKEVADFLVKASENYSSLRIAEIEILRKLY